MDWRWIEDGCGGGGVAGWAGERRGETLLVGGGERRLRGNRESCSSRVVVGEL